MPKAGFVSVFNLIGIVIMTTQTSFQQSTVQTQRSPKILYLSKEDIVKLGGASSELYVEALTNVFAIHSHGNFVQPLKPYLRTKGKAGHIADRIIAMPAHIAETNPVSGIKWIGSKHDNPVKRGLERASGLIILNDPDSNYPIAILEASLISSMRTAAVTVVAAKYLAKDGFQAVTCIGCGVIAQSQLKSLLEQFPSITTIHLFDLKREAAENLAAQLKQVKASVEVAIAPTAEAAVKNGEVVITCTVADRPYLEFNWLQPGAFVSNISIMDLKKDVFLQADKVVVDDWEQANREKKILNQLVIEGHFSRERLHAELGEIIIGAKPGRQTQDEIIVLNPMGIAIEDLACAQQIYQKALNSGVGNNLSLY